MLAPSTTTLAVAPNSAKLVYTTATAIPPKVRRTHTDDDDAPSPAATSTRVADLLYVFRRHERLDLLIRSASTTRSFKRTRVRPLATTRPLSAPDPGTTVGAQHARRYNATALHLYKRRYTSTRQQTFSSRSTPLLLHPPTNREAIAADNASDLASDSRRTSYITGCLSRNAYATEVTQQLRAPNVLYALVVGRYICWSRRDCMSCKHIQPLHLGHRQLVPRPTATHRPHADFADSRPLRPRHPLLA
jgi:hypothetical protein